MGHLPGLKTIRPTRVTYMSADSVKNRRGSIVSARKVPPRPGRQIILRNRRKNELKRITRINVNRTKGNARLLGRQILNRKFTGTLALPGLSSDFCSPKIMTRSHVTRPFRVSGLNIKRLNAFRNGNSVTTTVRVTDGRRNISLNNGNTNRNSSILT